MKRLINLYICIISILSIGMTSCSDDEKEDMIDFKGSDASIISFRLEKNEQTYEGVIRGTDIIITLPTDISLTTGVTPHISYSENATLSPDPSAITNWEEKEQFTVRAYDGTTTVYTYSVVRETNQADGVIILTTQEEVNSFAARDIHILDGSLIIGKENPAEDEEGITDLSTLSSLQQILYDLVINPGYVGSSLGILENLKSAGSITLNNLPEVSRVEAPNLQTITYDLYITGNAVESVNFPDLEYVGKNISLYTPGLVSAGFTYLKNTGGDIILPGDGSHPLETLSFPLLETTGGTINIQNYPSLNSLQLPELLSAGGLEIAALPMVRELSFPALQEVEESIQYGACQSVTSLCFPRLVKAGRIYFPNANNPLLETLDFSALKTVAGELNITFNQYASLKYVDFPALQQVEGDLRLSLGASRLFSVVERIRMPELVTIQGRLNIAAAYTAVNQTVHELDFTSLREAGIINITYLEALDSFASFAGLFREGEYTSWAVTNCGYNPSEEDMKEGKYSAE